ncbi:DNA repair protein REV1 [Agrilus planipennis]|uniref:DNA repair protein REV1 n=1 Tax=Agrilus planipennis TaxID=224129 RepID=A0A7F5RE09_AGRPL|nr:DNA repair protein REV1 [Agrilus planipennis]
MHIDMDCFFVSVGLRNRPDLKGKPVAVTHAKGSHNVSRDESSFETEKALLRKHWPSEKNILNKLDSHSSMSEIASCSYEARKYGIKNGMFLGNALKMCPNLQTIPYDFQGYREVSSILYNTIAQYTLDIEAVSCDEMYVDVGPILNETGISVEQWATHIRLEIVNATGCPCSTGFGSNRLQARLATRKAKPAGQFYLRPENVEEFLANVSLADLPGVGFATIGKLRNLGLITCADVQMTSLQYLQTELGTKMGEQIYDQARGIDTKPLSFYHERKSVSADVNYGIRFKTHEEILDFLKRLSEEVFNRLIETGMKAARCLTLKILIRAPDAPQETAKFLGCGVCTSINKSTTRGNLINDASVVFKEVKHLLDQIKAPPEDFRGIGIQLTRLEKLSASNKLLNNFLKQSTEIAKGDKNTKEIVSRNDTSNDTVKETCYKNREERVKKDNIPSPEEKNKDEKVCPVFKEVAIQCSGNPFDDDIPQVKIISTGKPTSLNNSKKCKPRGKLAKNKQNNISNNTVRTLKNYFNETRANKAVYQKSSAKSGKEILKNIDVEVLKELPEDIRNEILNEYKISMEEFQQKVNIIVSKANNTDISNTVITDDKVKPSTSSTTKKEENVQSSITKKKLSFADLEWDELKNLIESWIHSETKPLNCDITRLGEYLKDLAINRKIETLHVLVKFLHRLETAKFLGCGVCTSINKSTTRGNLINDASVVFKEVKHLLDQIKAPPEDFRGIGIQLTRLEKLSASNKLLNNFLKQSTEIAKGDKNTKEIVSRNDTSNDTVKETCYKNREERVKKDNIPSPEEKNKDEKVCPVFKEVAIQCSGNPFDDDIPQVKIISTGKPSSLNNSKKCKPRGKLAKNKQNNISNNTVRTLKNYFNETRANKAVYQKSSPKTGKEILKNIDVEVLKELPEDIRNEILNEYKISMEEFQQKVNIIVSKANNTDISNTVITDDKVKPSTSSTTNKGSQLIIIY